MVSYVYDAWGRPISKTGSMASTLGTVQPFRYRGYVYDEETEQFYLRSRYYKPLLCKFDISNCKFDQASGHTACNLYCYCANRPINTYDPTGYDIWSDAWESFCEVWINPWVDRADAVREDPSVYTIGNWLTCGSFDVVKGAVAPEEPLSPQHWLDSATVVAWTLPLVIKWRGSSMTSQLRHTSTSMAHIGQSDVFPNPLSDVQYTDKVKAQISIGDFHNFPTLLDELVQTGDVIMKVGKDGCLHKYISLPGSINRNGKIYEGVYEWIIDIPNVCNHHLFNRNPK